tara:strand:+ start:10280 stop:10999 length:720 start_codon:yes stop_codon:yes gene_type:complete
MIKNTINEEEAFAINENLDTRVYTFGKAGVRVLVVDNFYQNPYLVRQLALDIPASVNRRIRGGNPALRINAFYELSGMAPIYNSLAKEFFPEVMLNWPHDYMQKSFMNATFMINVMQSEDLPPLAPHQDNRSGMNLASTIYLNDENESAGGTSFYEFGGKHFYTDDVVNNDFNVTMDVEGKIPVTSYITDSSHDWEMIGMIPMSFNRMILYNQAVLHTAYVKPGMFVNDNYRMNQQFFI